MKASVYIRKINPLLEHPQIYHCINPYLYLPVNRFINRYFIYQFNFTIKHTVDRESKIILWHLRNILVLCLCSVIIIDDWLTNKVLSMCVKCDSFVQFQIIHNSLHRRISDKQCNINLRRPSSEFKTFSLPNRELIFTRFGFDMFFYPI